MRTLLCRLVVAVLLCGASLALHAEVIEFRSGVVVEGEVLDITADKVTVRTSEGAVMSVLVKDLTPYSVYRIRGDRLAPEDAQGHFALGEFCEAGNLLVQARALYRRAGELDRDLGGVVADRIAAVEEMEACSLYEQGVAYLKSGKYEEALKRFGMLRSQYPKSTWAEQAVAQQVAAAAAIQEANEKKAKQLELLDQKAKNDQLAQGEKGLKGGYEKAGVLVETAQKKNVEALDWEGQTKVSRADRTFQEAAAFLEEAEGILDEVLLRTKDVDLIAAARERRAEARRWRVLVYDNLGHLWAMELNLREATRWLNKALAIDPLDHVATELKLEVARQRLRRSSPYTTDPGVRK